jgi:tripartite-type tricarboxylate transporter receptor subunit TctC
MTDTLASSEGARDTAIVHSNERKASKVSYEWRTLSTAPAQRTAVALRRRNYFFETLTAVALAAFSVGGAAAQSDYPNHTIKIVVPAPPGPSLDSLPRLIANHVSGHWNIPVIIENIPGAAQNLGSEAVARADPDGYTILAAPPGPLVISQYVYSKLGFDPDAFVPVSIFATQPTVLVASTSAPFSTMPEMIAYAKANPGKINYASPGVGSSLQLEFALLCAEAGINIVHVPYKGIGPAEADLLAGHVDVMIDPLGNALQYIKAGKFKALGVTSASQIADLPSVPTIAKTFPDFVFTEFFAFVAPPKTTSSIATKLSQEIGDTVRLPDVAQRFRDLSITPVGSSPIETAALLKEESGRWRKIVTQLGVKID